MIIYKDESYILLGAMYEVYRVMGKGFLESVYQECMVKEFTLQNVPFLAQPMLKLNYKGQDLEQIYRPDFICYDKIIIEIKAVSELCTEHEAQLHNYLHATGIKLGILANFGHYPGFQFKRIAL